MIMTFELDLDRVMTNNRANYLGQRSFRLKFSVRTHTQPTGCTNLTCKVVGKQVRNETDVIEHIHGIGLHTTCMLKTSDRWWRQTPKRSCCKYNNLFSV